MIINIKSFLELPSKAVANGIRYTFKDDRGVIHFSPHYQCRGQMLLTLMDEPISPCEAKELFKRSLDKMLNKID